VLPNVVPATGGVTIAIVGTNFQMGASVTVNGSPAANVLVVSDTLILCDVPPSAVGPAALTVTNPDGLSVVLPGAFNYVALLAITAVSPAGAQQGQTVTLQGAGFQNGLTVVINGVPAVVTSVQPSVATFVVPAGVGCNAPIIVTNPDGQTAVFGFNPNPVITSTSGTIAPAAGGSQFIVLGTSFTAGSTVSVGGAPATILTLTPTAIVAVAPPGSAGPTTLTVTSPYGCSATAAFTYL
jgi:hypothetical protein